MQEVKSSNIKSVGYDKENEILEIEFKSGATWEYLAVTEEKYKEMMEADSIGRYFIKNIRGFHCGQKVLKLSEELEQMNVSGDFGKALEGFPEKVLVLENEIERLKKELGKI